MRHHADTAGTPARDGGREWMPRWFKVLIEAGKAWNADDAFKHSASVAFYTLFSLAPITLIAVGIAGFFFGQETAAHQFSAQVGQLVGKESAELVQKTMEANALQRGACSRPSSAWPCSSWAPPPSSGSFRDRSMKSGE